MFVVSKMTGLEKPVVADFEEFPLEIESQGGLSVSQQFPDNLEEWSAQPTSATGKVREGKSSPPYYRSLFLSYLSVTMSLTSCLLPSMICVLLFLTLCLHKLLSCGWESLEELGCARLEIWHELLTRFSSIVLMFLSKSLFGMWKFWTKKLKYEDESKKKSKKTSISNNKEEKKEKRGKKEDEDSRVSGMKQGSRRATSLLNLFTSSSSPIAQQGRSSHQL